MFAKVLSPNFERQYRSIDDDVTNIAFNNNTELGKLNSMSSSILTKSGMFRMNIDARNPMSKIKYEGELYILGC